MAGSEGRLLLKVVGVVGVVLGWSSEARQTGVESAPGHPATDREAPRSFRVDAWPSKR